MSLFLGGDMRNRDFLEAINIFRKYITKDKMDNYDLYAEHDQIWFLDYEEITFKKDIKRLEELGWFKDEDAWSCYT